MTLTLLPLIDTYSVWQPPLSHPVVLVDFQGCEFFTYSQSAEEQSVICPVGRLPKDAPGKVEGPWKGFKVEGELDFALVGIMAEISSVLAENKISLFAISTFNTDYILVKEDKFEAAKTALATRFKVGHANG